VKGFLTHKMGQEIFKEYSNLTVYNVDEKSMLAMKLTSARLDSKDMEDAIAIMDKIHIKSEDELIDIIEEHTDKQRQTAQSYFFTLTAYDEYQNRQSQRDKKIKTANIISACNNYKNAQNETKNQSTQKNSINNSNASQ